ncbi:MAG: DinB family protein [Candidatus Hydrogenedens sp.]|nr:DinB family protein [Candidatus Hydrogenedens sp.]
MEISSAAVFIDYYGKLRQRTLKVVACIPPERIEWRYADGKWSLGDIVRHLGTIERWMYGETLQGEPSRYAGCGPELAEGYDAVVAYLTQMHEETLGILRGFSDDDLQAKCITPGDAPITRWKWMRAMTEHEIHHRGQLYTALGVLGVPTPPLFGLTAEEVAAKADRL